MAKTDKFNAMIESFECCFSLAVEGDKSLGSLDALISAKNNKIIKDIELLEELSWLLRNGKAEIHLVEEAKTQADIIRSMSDEELIEFIAGLNEHCLAGIGKVDCSSCNGYCEEYCKKMTRNWLQSKVE